MLDAGGADFAPDLARVATRYALAHEHICDTKNESAFLPLYVLLPLIKWLLFYHALVCEWIRFITQPKDVHAAVWQH